jgi:FkbM family methyltransferase
VNTDYLEFMLKLQEELQICALPKDTTKQPKARAVTVNDLAATVAELVLHLKPKTILEIGAHEASFSRTIKQKLPDSRVVAFEANPQVHEKFKAIVEATGVEYRFQCIADENRTYDFLIPGKEPGKEVTTMGSIHNTNIWSMETMKKYQVEGRRLDDFLGDGIATNAMWVDVEGAIGSVLAGAENALKHTVLFFAELEATARWDGQILDVDVIAKLAEQGLYPVLRDIQRHKWQHNIVFLHQDVLRSPAVLQICARFMAKTLAHVRAETAPPPAQRTSPFSDNYPVNPRPRWGFGKPVHSTLQAVLDKSRGTYESVLQTMSSNRAALHAVPYQGDRAKIDPYWNNVWFSCLDAASLVNFLLDRKPNRYLEIGSGYSTMFARHAIRWGKLNTSITSIDPQPRAGIDALCDSVIRKPLEECELSIFENLGPGDILFFDGSHRVFPNSDVTTFFLDILPRLPSGLLVHVHDIFLPSDYPPQWNSWLYSEQYLIAAMLLCQKPPFKVVLPNFFVCNDPALSKQVKQIFHPEQGTDIPFLYKNNAQIPGVSFWFEIL